MEYITNLIISLMVGVIIGCLVVTLIDKMSLFCRLVLLIAALCLIYILNEWLNVYITGMGAVITFGVLAISQVAKDKEVEE
jgi:uncharacterized membrane protein YoaK (UPF0700 family)